MSRSKAKLLLVTMLCVLLSIATALGQSSAGRIRKGNREYKKEEYKQAELEYRKALDADTTSAKARYNLGAALYKQGRYGEAAKRYSSLIEEQGIESKLGGNSLYNAANSYFQEEQYGKSVELYKQALRANPRDESARYNLSEALRRLQRQEQEKHQDQQKKDQQQEKNRQEGKDKQNQPQKDQGGEDSKKQQGEQQDQQKKGQQGGGSEQQAGQGQKMSEAEARQILNALEKQQGKAAERVQKAKQKGGKPRQPEKDW